MIDHALVDELSNSFDLPREALTRAAANPASITPPVLDVLNQSAGGAELTDEQANLLRWGIHVIALARDRRAYRPLMRLLRDQDPHAVFGDLVTHTMSTVIVSVFDGSSDLLFDLLADRNVDPMVRWSMFDAVTYLTLDGSIARSETEAFLARFTDEDMAEPEDMVWVGWQEAIARLGLRTLAPRVKAAFRGGLVHDGLCSWKEFSAELKRAEAGPDDARSPTGHHYHTIGEVLADVTQMQELEDEEIGEDEIAAAFGALEEAMTGDPEPRRRIEKLPDTAHSPKRHVGRNDPCPCGSGKKAKRCCLA